MMEGIFVPHVTPFKRDGEIDFDALEVLIPFWKKMGIGLVSLGSNGEAVFLSREERQKVLEFVVERAGKVIAGTGAAGTKETIDFTKDAADVGAEAALIVSPYYFKPSPEEVFEHYSRIIDAVDIPIILYSVPKFTGYEIDLQTISKLVDEHSQIIGIKDSSGSIGRIAELVRLVGDRIKILAGTGDLILPSLIMGASGAIVAIANVAPEICERLCGSFRKGDLETAKELQLKLTHLNEILVKRFNQLSTIKEALNLLGLNAGFPRLPMLPLGENERNEIRNALVSLGLLESED
ncbi:MAG: 4-hydroxy-tetrahydrodipicolinate synthase [Archaeoglobus sp.]|nr:4-hydroxy-tetrahydrodipicolinate synthase [Archaeoglobus sp.]